MDHPDHRLLRKYRHRGYPIVFLVQRWTKGQQRAALDRGLHKSTVENVPFFREEFDLMSSKGQWVVLPYLVANELLGLRLILPGVKEERYLRPQWIGDYSYTNLNYENLPIYAMSSMQYGRYLERLIREVVISDPALVPMHILKADVSDSFYRIGLRTTDAHNLGIVFYSGGEDT